MCSAPLFGWDGAASLTRRVRAEKARSGRPNLYGDQCPPAVKRRGHVPATPSHPSSTHVMGRKSAWLCGETGHGGLHARLRPLRQPTAQGSEIEERPENVEY